MVCHGYHHHIGNTAFCGHTYWLMAPTILCWGQWKRWRRILARHSETHIFPCLPCWTGKSCSSLRQHIHLLSQSASGQELSRSLCSFPTSPLLISHQPSYEAGLPPHTEEATIGEMTSPVRSSLTLRWQDWGAGRNGKELPPQIFFSLFEVWPRYVLLAENWMECFPHCPPPPSPKRYVPWYR